MSKIMLSNGEMFDLLNPDDCEYGIEEVAHALSNITRFNGHTREFYSVASMLKRARIVRHGLTSRALALGLNWNYRRSLRKKP